MLTNGICDATCAVCSILDVGTYQSKENGEEDSSCQDLSEGEDLPYDYSDDDGDVDDDFGPEGVSTEGVEGDSPFAPAEMYLSDLIDVNCASARSGMSSPDRMHVYIPDDMVYCPCKYDPLCKISIQKKLGELFKAATDEPEGKHTSVHYIRNFDTHCFALF